MEGIKMKGGGRVPGLVGVKVEGNGQGQVTHTQGCRRSTPHTQRPDQAQHTQAYLKEIKGGDRDEKDAQDEAEEGPGLPVHRLCGGGGRGREVAWLGRRGEESSAGGRKGWEGFRSFAAAGAAAASSYACVLHASGCFL